MFLNKQNKQSSISAGAVVITGASTGIGKAAALMLDKRGFHVFAGVRKQADGDKLRAEASERLVPVMLDVTVQDTVTAVSQQVQSEIKTRNIPNGLIGLVNNAGIVVAGPSEFLPMEDIRWQFEVNVFGAMAVTQTFLAQLREAKGRIINTSSIAGRFSNPFMGPYSASKFALEAFSDALRVELRPWDIHVSLIEPGEVATPIWEKTLDTSEKIMAKLPPETATLYGPAMRMLQKIAANAGGISADVVAEAIVHALTAVSPKARYLIGKDAKQMAVIGKLPTPLRDRLVANFLPDYGNNHAKE